MKTNLLTIAATLLLAASVSSVFADNWIGNSAVNVNGTWYYAGSNLTWCSGGAFHGANLGEISALHLGGQSQVYDNKTGAHWNAGRTINMFYKIDGANTEPIPNIPLTIFAWEGYGNNMAFQSGGSSFSGTPIDISGFEAGSTHTIEVFFQATCDDGNNVWDSNNSNNYKATFTIKAPKIVESSADFENVSEGDDVKLSGLTLYKDGYWNTLCLPFSLSQGDVEMSELAGADIRQLSSSSLSSDGTLTLNFSEVSSITAGTPYIIKWNEGSHIVDPIFTGVTISANEPGYKEGDYMFTGCFVPTGIDGQEYLYLGADNYLYYPSESVTIGAFHAYFVAGNSQAEAKAFVLNFDDDNETTGIKQISNLSNLSNSYFTLDGRRLNDKPATPGLYIINGKKVVIK